MIWTRKKTFLEEVFYALYIFCSGKYILYCKFIYKLIVFQYILMDDLLIEVFTGLPEAYSRYGLYRLEVYKHQLLGRFDGEYNGEDVEAIFIAISGQIQEMRCEHGNEFMRFALSLTEADDLEKRVRAVINNSP